MENCKVIIDKFGKDVHVLANDMNALWAAVTETVNAEVIFV